MAAPERSGPPAKCVPASHVPAALHLAALLDAQRAALAEREDGVRRGEDPEELRRFRVATRRLRALLRAGRPLLDPRSRDELRAELAWLGDMLGPVRDLDVLLADMRTTAGHLEPGEQFPLGRVLRELEEEREAARSELLAALASARYAALSARLEEGLATELLVTADVSTRDLAAWEFRKLRRAARRLDEYPTDEALHDLRLRVKRSRYAAELAEMQGGPAASRFLRRAKTLQDVLGAHQDASLAELRIRSLLRRPGNLRWAIAAGRLIEAQYVRRETARAALPAAWSALAKAGRAAWS